MNPRRKSDRWAWLVLLVALLPALARWWVSALPGGPDQAIHVYRAVELDWAISQGTWYPRWAADLVYGYGYPLFNVYGPGAQYLIVLLHRLGLSFVSATLVAFALADVIGALGAFTFGRGLFGPRAGLLTALAYAYAPYVLMSLHRGALPEALGLALLPWLLGSLWELHRSPGAWAFARTAALFAAFPFIHNPSTALAGGCAVALTIALSLAARGRERWRSTAACFGALGLGLVVSAWYWVPVVFEVGAIHIERAYSPPVLDYHFHFLPLGEMLSWPRAFDRTLIGDETPRALGWPQVALAVAALAAIGRHPARQRAAIGAAALGALGLATLALPWAVVVWERVPGLSLIQFPARLLGPASLLLSILAGSLTADGVARPAARRWMVPIAAVILMLYALPWTYGGLDPSVPANPTLSDIHDWERRTGTIGTTTAGEYLPITVQSLPDADALREAYASGALFERLDRGSLPTGAQAKTTDVGYTRQQVTIDSTGAFTAVFNTFAFPGWRAVINGVDVPITPTTPDGRISVAVPAGRSEIAIDFGTTPARQAGGALSLIGLLTLAALGLTGWARRAPAEVAGPLSFPAPREVAAVIAVGLAIVVYRQATLEIDTPFARSSLRGDVVEGVPPLNVDFGGAMRLIGMRVGSEPFAAGSALDVDLYWRALQPARGDYSVQLSLRDAVGHVVAQTDSQHPAGFPTSRWSLDDYARDSHALTPYSGTPPGPYQLAVTVYRQTDGAQLSAPIPIGAVTVTCPLQPPSLEPVTTLNAMLGPVKLLGVDWTVTSLNVGDNLAFTAYWDPLNGTDRRLVGQVNLIDTNGKVASSQTLALVNDDYPTTAWRPGCPLRAPLDVRVPATLTGGLYNVELQVLDGSAAVGDAIALGGLTVHAPERSFEAPAYDHAVGARFGSVAELVGWTRTDEGSIRLIWKALSTSDVSYTVFIHALDTTDTILSQSDSPPVGGARPTTSWIVGEHLSDTITLANTADVVRYRVGLYDPVSGERLTTPDGADFVILQP